MGLVSELKRCNVFHMTVLYVVAAWLIMQVAEVIVALANLPDRTGHSRIACDWFFNRFALLLVL
jgi:hypothetical protein